jgi:acetyl/propionyl-CoA carboxylase alpha subunit
MRFKFESNSSIYSVIPLGNQSIRIIAPDGSSRDFRPRLTEEIDWLLPGPILLFEDSDGEVCSFLQIKDRFFLHWNGNTHSAKLEAHNFEDSTSVSLEIRSPMPGKLIKIFKKPGDLFEKGEVLGVLEAMKMENQLKAGFPGKISQVLKKEGEIVSQDEVLIVLEPLP